MYLLFSPSRTFRFAEQIMSQGFWQLEGERWARFLGRDEVRQYDAKSRDTGAVEKQI